MDDTITFIATQDGQTFTETIKLLDVLVAELRLDDSFHTCFPSRQPLRWGGH